MRARWLLVVGSVVTLLTGVLQAVSSCDNQGFNGNTPQQDADNGPVDVLTPETVKVATFDTDGVPYKMSSGSPQVDYTTRVSQVAQVIAGLKADVIVLQHVGGAMALSDIASQAALMGGFPYQTMSGVDSSGLGIGVLADIPIAATISHNRENFTANGMELPQGGGGFEFTPDLLEVHFNLNRLLVIFAASLQAPSSSLSATLSAEAMRTNTLAVSAEGADSRVLVVGGFGDVPSSATVQSIVGMGSTALSSAVGQLPASQQSTGTLGGQPAVLDDQLADPSLAQNRDPSMISVVRGGDLNPSLQGVSSHAAVVVTYKLQ